MNQCIKFLRGATPSSQLQKSKMGAIGSMKKSRPTMSNAPQIIESHLKCITRLAIVAVRNVNTIQLIPINGGTPIIFGPRLFP